MLAEYLQDADSDVTANWHDVMQGVKVCNFEMNKTKEELPVYLSVEQKLLHFEALFCCGGTLIIGRKHGAAVTTSKNEILLISDKSNFTSSQIVTPLKGILISIEGNDAKKSFEQLYQLLNKLHVYINNIKQLMDEQKGCILIRSTPWSRSAFSTLESLTLEEQGRYCTLKTMELLYLLCMNSDLTDSSDNNDFSDSYIIRTVTDMQNYMHEHIDEKITIDDICHRYNISTTAFKRYFKFMFGKPVHKWVSEQRMIKAAEFLHSTPMSVLQIAQAVGYDGVSQFNVVFKRKYGITPGQYRKISNTVKI